MLAYPSNRVVDLAELIGSKIENIYFALGPVESCENSIDAILHIQIRLALMPIAQYVQMVRMFGKLLPEIKNMAMGIPLAQNRHKTENVALHTEAFAIRLNQPLRRQFRSAIQRGL